MRTILWSFALLAVAAVRAQSRDVDPFADSISLTHFDVGQGDATLITTTGGRRILIDAGSPGSAIAARLRAAGIDTLDLVVSTHNDADHVGGMVDVFANLVVLKYIDNDLRCRTYLCEQTRDAAQSEPGLENVQPYSRADTIDGVTLRILPPSAIDSSESTNAVGVLVEHGSFHALYTGDSESRQLQYWLARGLVSQVDLLMAPQHGSTRATNWRWMTTTQPSLLIVSVGAPNAFAYPSKIVLKLWRLKGARIMRTDTEGTVQVSASRDGSYIVRTYPGARATGSDRGSATN